MKKNTKQAAPLFTFQKYVGIFCVLIGIPVFLFDARQGAEMLLLIGLFTLFTAPQKPEDERSVSLKASSLYLSFILAYVFKLLSSNLYSHHLIPFEMTAINHFMILVFSLSLVIYYFRFYSFR